MFEGWSDFYLMAGGAAAVLIGLIFVVISLMSDRPRSSVLAGSRLYMGPIVLGLSFVLAISAAGLAPAVSRQGFAAITTVVAAWGLVRGVASTIGIRRLGSEVHWTDIWFYGLLPIALYLAIGLVALALWMDWRWAELGIGGSIMLSLLLAIRNEWDLITWIVPRSGDVPEFDRPEGSD